jgi:ABC-type multidrug transport system permease subunit
MTASKVENSAQVSSGLSMNYRICPFTTHYKSVMFYSPDPWGLDYRFVMYGEWTNFIIS